MNDDHDDYNTDDAPPCPASCLTDLFTLAPNLCKRIVTAISEMDGDDADHDDANGRRLQGTTYGDDALSFILDDNCVNPNCAMEVIASPPPMGCGLMSLIQGDNGDDGPSPSNDAKKTTRIKKTMKEMQKFTGVNGVSITKKPAKAMKQHDEKSNKSKKFMKKMLRASGHK
jgi:hypothetical protein